MKYETTLEAKINLTTSYSESEDTTYIDIPKGYKYLSEVFNHLPSNCYLDKQMTGCGATTTAITDSRPTVIAVPRINMIINKCDQHPELIGVYGGVTNNEVSEMMLSKGVDKWICTYDSLERVVSLLGDVSNYHLVVDEIHCAVRESGDLKAVPINKLTTLINLFKDVVFLTATPTIRKWTPPFLMAYPLLRLRWGDSDVATLKTCFVEVDVNRAIAACVLDAIDKGGVPFVYINSVRGIADAIKIIRKMRPYNHNDIKIICANNEVNEKKLQNGLGNDYKPEQFAKKGEQEKKIVFITKSSFEGSDAYCPNPVTIIVYDAKNRSRHNTRLDIMVDIPQILGRQRAVDDNWKTENYMLYTAENEIKGLSEDDYEAALRTSISAFHKVLEAYYEDQTLNRKSIASGLDMNYFSLCLEGREFEYNPLAIYAMMSLYGSLHQTYYIRSDKTDNALTVLKESFNQEMFTVPKLSVIDSQKLTKRSNYRGYMLEYIGALEDGDLQKMEDIKADCELVADLVTELTPLRCSQYSYNWTKLKAIYDAEMGVSSIKQEHLPDVSIGMWYSLKELKELVNEAYERAGIDKKGKAVDVLQWYDCKRAKRVGNEGYIIESLKQE